MTPPVLWHVSFSNYGEKARWALDYKGVPHRRREPPPGLHPVWARRMGGRTIPLLVMDGETFTDSSAIVAELERRAPDPPLYPHDPAERERALALEDFFDEDLGHEVRRVALDAARHNPEIAVSAVGPKLGRVLGALRGPIHAVADRYYGITPETVERAWEKIAAAVDRFHAERGASGYLAGDAFSIADLTFAALLSPTVVPPGFPYRRLVGVPELRDYLAERDVVPWIEEMYARHRGRWTRA
jgi:glutathione S-transferase